MSAWSFDIGNGVDLVGENIGFNPQSVIVDNYSNHWLFLQDAGRYIGPYTTGAILPLFHANAANAKWQTPAGVTQTPQTLGGGAHLTFTDAVLAYIPGAPSVPKQVVLGVNTIINIPAGASTIAAVLGAPLGNIAYNIMAWDLNWGGSSVNPIFPTTMNIWAYIQQSGVGGSTYGGTTLSSANPSNTIDFGGGLTLDIGKGLNINGYVIGGVAGTLVSFIRYFLS